LHLCREVEWHPYATVRRHALRRANVKLVYLKSRASQQIGSGDYPFLPTTNTTCLPVHDVDPASAWLMLVSAVSRRNGATRSEWVAPFDISPRVTYNFVSDAKYCHVKTLPLTADLVAYAMTMKR